MRKVFLLISIVCLLFSCASTETDIKERNEDGSPIWSTEVPQSKKYVYGVGRAKLSNEVNSQNAADANARADLAKKLQVMMSDAVGIYSNDSEGSTVAAYESITVQTVNISIRNIKVEQHYTSPDGTIWSLVSVPVKNLDKIYGLEANNYKNKLEEEKLALQEKYLKLLAELELKEDQMEADSLRNAAKDYLDNQTDSIDEKKKSINVDKLTRAVKSFMEQNGYELN